MSPLAKSIASVRRNAPTATAARKTEFAGHLAPWLRLKCATFLPACSFMIEEPALVLQ
jgi:hypothetical protein